MNILITGANGFIGSHLARHLAGKGHKLRGLIRTSSRLDNLQGIEIDLAYGDITVPASLVKPMQGIDLVIHTAGAVTDWGSLAFFDKQNVEGLQHVFRAAEAAGVRRFVHIGTVAIYGFGRKEIKEEDPFAESHVGYCISKRKAVEWLKQIAGESKMEITVIHPGNVFGPGDDKFILPYLQLLDRNRFVFVNGGRAWTCPTYIENLVHGIGLAAFHPAAAGETFNITDGLEIDWKTFTEALYRGIGKKPITRSVPHPLIHTIAFGMETFYKLIQSRQSPALTRYRIDNAGLDYHFSIGKARRILGYEPPVDFQTSVDHTTEWYLESKKLRIKRIKN